MILNYNQEVQCAGIIAAVLPIRLPQGSERRG